jgi:hypothetical protein
MSDEMRAVIDAILPEGTAWIPAPGEDLDRFYDGLAINWETIRAFLAEQSSVRDPHFTPFLEDLEREFGVFTNPNLSDQQRRDQLSPVVFNRQNNGSNDNLEAALNDAGFAVQVHDNSPAVDPAIFLDQDFQMVSGGENSFSGNPEAYSGRTGGELLVNGDVFNTRKSYTAVSGSFGSGDGTVSGEYDELIREKIEYDIPTDPNDWPLVFFVGGDATRDGSGALTEIESVDIPQEQESAFKRIILKYKPIHSWAALIVNFV